MALQGLEAAIAENLRVRGVQTRLESALLSEICLALRGTDAAPPAAAPAHALSDSLVAEYLAARGYASTLLIFSAESGALPPPGAPLPGASLSPGAALPAADAALALDTSLGATLARSAAERIARACTGAVSSSLPPGPASADAVASYLRKRSSNSGSAGGSGDGSSGGEAGASAAHLPRALVAKELGLRAAAQPAQPLLQLLVEAARKAAVEGAVAVPGWLGAQLGAGAQEELAAACAAIEAAAAAQRLAAEEPAPALPGAAAAATAPLSHLVPPMELDSDEDIPGALQRVAAFNARATTAARVAQGTAAALGAGPAAAGAPDARFFGVAGGAGALTL